MTKQEKRFSTALKILGWMLIISSVVIGFFPINNFGESVLDQGLIFFIGISMFIGRGVLWFIRIIIPSEEEGNLK